MAHVMMTAGADEMVGSSPLALGASALAGAAAGYAWGRGTEPARRLGIAAGVGGAAFALSITFAKGSVGSHLLNGAAAMAMTFAAGSFSRGRPSHLVGLSPYKFPPNSERVTAASLERWKAGVPRIYLVKERMGSPYLNREGAQLGGGVAGYLHLIAGIPDGRRIKSFLTHPLRLPDSPLTESAVWAWLDAGDVVPWADISPDDQAALSHHIIRDSDLKLVKDWLSEL